MTFNQTAHSILDAAESKTQLLGLNAFSYKDLQNEVGIKTSSIHYYFPTKHDLVVGMIGRYIERYLGIIDNIEKECAAGTERLEALGKVFVKVVEQGKFCVCGMLSSDLLSLSEQAISELDAFFSLNQRWIAEAIELAKSQRHFKDTIEAEKAAKLFFAALEGGMLVARAKNSASHLEEIIEQAIDLMKNS